MTKNNLIELAVCLIVISALTCIAILDAKNFTHTIPLVVFYTSMLVAILVSRLK